MARGTAGAVPVAGRHRDKEVRGRGRAVILAMQSAIYSALRAQVLCESRGGRPGLPVRNSPCGLCGRKATY